MNADVDEKQPDPSQGQAPEAGAGDDDSHGRAVPKTSNRTGAGGKDATAEDDSKQMTLPALAVAIPETEVEKGYIQQQIVYVVTVSAFGLSSTSRHVFEDFETLHANLTAKVKFSLPPIPPTYFFGNDAPQVVQERQERLERLLQQLVKLPEVMRDGEEMLLRFLQLPKATCAAVRFLISAQGDRPYWLTELYETTAQPNGFLVLQERNTVEALLSTAWACLAKIGSAAVPAGQKQREDMYLVCELLARSFRSDGDVAAEGEEQGGDVAPEGGAGGATGSCSAQGAQEHQPRGEAVKLLLECMTCEKIVGQAGSEDNGSHKHPSTFQAAAKALLTLARAGRDSWSRNLLEFLNDDGIQRFATANEVWARTGGKHQKALAMRDSVSGGAAGTGGCSSTAPESYGPRLIAELLLRGFEGPVVARFAKHDVAAERKQLLNHFFVSQDPFVRVSVGLLLSRLLCEAWYTEAVKAEKGVQGLYEELLSPKAGGLACDAMKDFLAEEEMQQWLCKVAAVPQPSASGFALLLIVELVPSIPPRVLEIPGLHETLIEKLDPIEDLAVRGPAARILLEAYRASAGASGGDGPPGSGPLPLPLELPGALAASVEAALLRSDDMHAALGEQVVQVRGLYTMASGLDQAMQQATSSAALLGNQIRVWSEVLEHFAAACRVAQEAHAHGGRVMKEERTCLLECGEQAVEEQMRQQGHEESGDSAILLRRRAELASQAADFAKSKAKLEDLAEAKNAITRQLVEHEDNVEGDALAQLAQQGKGRLLVKAAELDEQMMRASEELPAQEMSLQHARKQVEAMVARRGDVLESFNHLLGTQSDCVQVLDGTSQRIEEVHGRFQEERGRRRGVREAVRQLALALQTLDEQLEALDMQEVQAEEMALAS